MSCLVMARTWRAGVARRLFWRQTWQRRMPSRAAPACAPAGSRTVVTANGDATDHFVHDIGAFVLGLGAGLSLAAAVRYSESAPKDRHRAARNRRSLPPPPQRAITTRPSPAIAGRNVASVTTRIAFGVGSYPATVRDCASKRWARARKRRGGTCLLDVCALDGMTRKTHFMPASCELVREPETRRHSTPAVKCDEQSIGS
jgi:hypothetical protein